MTFQVELMHIGTGKRVKIDPAQACLSRMRRRITAWSEVIKEVEVSGPQRKVMICLSYDTEGTHHEEPYDWKPNHIRDYVKKLKKKLGDNLIAVGWVAEMQRRGTVHYHVYIIVRKGTRIPMPDELGMWPWGSSNIQTGRSPFYLVAYLKSKGGQKAYQKMGFPKGCRIFAVWVQKKLLRLWVWTRFRWSSLPAWLREELDVFGFALVGLFPKRNEGGGWILKIPIDRKEFFGWPQSIIEFHSPWVLV